MKEIAARELRSVGDAGLGEWEEQGDIAFHLRRRLTVAEMRYAGIIAVVDVRGTAEHEERIGRMRPFLPSAFAQRPTAEFP